jgi:uncharacterized membrane protein
MDAPYIHLLVNHFPIVLAVVGAVAAVIAFITGHRSTWTFSLGALLLAGLAVYPAVFTGKDAEQVMEKVWFVDGGRIEAHENAATLAMWFTIGTGILALVAIWRERTAYTGGRTVLATPRPLRGLVALAAVASAGLLGWAAWEGGFIVHKAERLRVAPADSVVMPDIPPLQSTPSGRTTGATSATVPLIQPPQRE